MSFLVNDVFPAGIVLPYAGATAPDGWLICNGSAVSRSVYSRLFLAIGVSCGYGDNATTFNVPDYRGVFLRGVSGVSSNDPDKLTRTAMNAGGNTGNSVSSIQSENFSSHNHGGGSHSHTVNAHSHGGGSHSHTVNAHSHGGGNHNHTIRQAAGAVSGTISRTGVQTTTQNQADTQVTVNAASGTIISSEAPGTSGPSATVVVSESPGTSGPSATVVPSDGGNETRPKNAYVNYIIKV